MAFWFPLSSQDINTNTRTLPILTISKTSTPLSPPSFLMHVWCFVTKSLPVSEVFFCFAFCICSPKHALTELCSCFPPTGEWVNPVDSTSGNTIFSTKHPLLLVESLFSGICFSFQLLKKEMEFEMVMHCLYEWQMYEQMSAGEREREREQVLSLPLSSKQVINHLISWWSQASRWMAAMNEQVIACLAKKHADAGQC